MKKITVILVCFMGILNLFSQENSSNREEWLQMNEAKRRMGSKS